METFLILLITGVCVFSFFTCICMWYCIGRCGLILCFINNCFNELPSVDPVDLEANIKTASSGYMQTINVLRNPEQMIELPKLTFPLETIVVNK